MPVPLTKIVLVAQGWPKQKDSFVPPDQASTVSRRGKVVRRGNYTILLAVGGKAA